MSDVIAVDPGARGVGWSLFRGGVLLGCGWAEPEWEGRKDSEHFRRVAWAFRKAIGPVTEGSFYHEKMAYRGSAAYAAGDLIDLSLVTGCCIGVLPESFEVHGVTPAQWKGQTSKVVNHARTMKSLSSGEARTMDLLKFARRKHDVMDAVGIGLWACKRRGLRV
jgi:hypothetical protein